MGGQSDSKSTTSIESPTTESSDPFQDLRLSGDWRLPAVILFVHPGKQHKEKLMTLLAMDEELATHYVNFLTAVGFVSKAGITVLGPYEAWIPQTLIFEDHFTPKNIDVGINRPMLAAANLVALRALLCSDGPNKIGLMTPELFRRILKLESFDARRIADEQRRLKITDKDGNILITADEIRLGNWPSERKSGQRRRRVKKLRPKPIEHTQTETPKSTLAVTEVSEGQSTPAIDLQTYINDCIVNQQAFPEPKPNPHLTPGKVDFKQAKEWQTEAYAQRLVGLEKLVRTKNPIHLLAIGNAIEIAPTDRLLGHLTQLQ